MSFEKMNTVSILTLLTLSMTVSAVKAESMMMGTGTPGMAPGLAAASASETQCIQQEMLACLSRPEIMADVMKIMSNPNEISQSQVLDNLCSHQQLVAELIFCLERTILECYFMKNFSIDGLPLIENWVDGLQFMCQHKKELFENNCSVSSNQEIKKCTGEISQTIINITKNSTQAEVNNFMCSSIIKMKSCVQFSFNSCSDAGKLWIEMIEKFFPTRLCPALSGNNSIMLSSTFVSWWNLSIIILWLFNHLIKADI